MYTNRSNLLNYSSATRHGSMDSSSQRKNNEPVLPSKMLGDSFPSQSIGASSPSSTAYAAPINSPSERHSKLVDSCSTIHPSALQAPYIRGSKSASTAAGQIESDIKGVRNTIANFGIVPLEMLHLVDRWLQQILGEFYDQRGRFKHKLSEKWQKQELTNVNYDNNDQIRRIYDAYEVLKRARDNILSRQSFDELNNYLTKTVDNTTNELKEKFNSLIENYIRILRCLEIVDKEIKAGNDNYINDTQKKLSSLEQLNNKQSHTICIVGLEKAGKSTFINALLGYELLPTASERCTQIRTVLKPPSVKSSSQQLFATVKFYNDTEFREYFDKMTKKTDEDEEQLQKRKEEVVQHRDNLKEKFPEEKFYINSSSDIETERIAIIKKLHNYITGELYLNIIKEIAIYTDRLPGKNYELLDVPGFDSPIKEHRDAGIQAVKSADAFLFLTNGQQPSLTEPQISLLQEIQQNHYEAMERAFGIITKLDLCHTKAKYKDHYEKTSAELIEKHFKPERIYVACPRMQILDENTEEYRVIDTKLRSFGDELVQGFERSKNGLNKFIEYELPKTHLRQLVNLGQSRLVRYVAERLDRIKEKQLLPVDLSTMSIDEYIKQQNVENWDKIYSEDIFEPVFSQANSWHTTVVTKERTKFIDDVKDKFYHSFLDLTNEFVQRKHPIEKLIFEKYDYSKLQLNAHPVDDDVRKKLSMELEKIVDTASDLLAEHFYYKYICELENILNDIDPQTKDLYRTKLTLEKCTNEVHALILRVCRPIITATLRYSHLDSDARQDAINELIYIASTVAKDITNHGDQYGVGILVQGIFKAVELLAGTNEMITPVSKLLFKK